MLLPDDYRVISLDPGCLPYIARNVCIIEPRVSVELRGRVTVILLERSARELDYK